MDGVVARRLVVVLTLALVLVVAWVAVCVRFVAHPEVDEPGRADAVVVLGGDGEVGWARGVELVRAGVADELVVSAPEEAARPCGHPPPGVAVTCFSPDPSTTRGEARAIAALADEHGWDEVVVVTWRTHVGRSRLIVERCFDGELRVVDDGLAMSPLRWAYEFAYQSGAWVKAQLLRGC